MENGLSLNLVDFNSLVVSSTNTAGDSATNTRRMLAKSWTSLLLGDEGEEFEHYSSSPPTMHHHLQNTHLNSDPNDLVVLHDFNENTSIVTEVINNDDTGSLDTVAIQQRLIKKQLECKKLRMLFSPPEMLTEGGEIEESYFRPDPSRIFNMDCLKTLTWNKTDEELLRKGINEFGNDWTAIILKYLPNWDAKELQEKCKQLKIATKKARTPSEQPKIYSTKPSTTSAAAKRKKKSKKEAESEEEEEYEENDTDEESIASVSEEEEKPKRKSTNKKNSSNSTKSNTSTISKTNKKSNSKQNAKSNTKKVAVTTSTKKKVVATTTQKKGRKQIVSDEDDNDSEEEEFNEGDFVSDEDEEMSDEEPPKSKRGSRSRPKRQVQRYCYHENSSGEDEMLDQYMD